MIGIREGDIEIDEDINYDHNHTEDIQSEGIDGQCYRP